jgi:hypothetical protein
MLNGDEDAMNISNRLLMAVLSLCLTIPAFPSASAYSGDKNADKELIRTAHRLRIPVEQLKNARKSLQEATDLANSMEPFPVNEIDNLAQSWNRLEPSRAEGVIESFLADVRQLAGNAGDINSYQRDVFAARYLIELLSSSNSEKAAQLSESWPQPPRSLGENARSIRNSTILGLRRNWVYGLTQSDPQSAFEQLSKEYAAGSLSHDSSVVSSLARGLAGAGMKEEAQSLINRTIRDFESKADDPDTLGNFRNFLQGTVSFMNSEQVVAAVNRLAQMKTRTSPDFEIYTMRKGDGKTDLTQDEYSFLQLVSSLQRRPQLLLQALAKFPELQSKLEPIGGIEAYLSSGFSGNDPVLIRHDEAHTDYSKTDTEPATREKLLRKFGVKAASSPDIVRRELRKTVRGPESINMLLALAGSATEKYPEMAEIALEISEQLLPRLESCEERMEPFWKIIQMYRKLNGEVDEDLLKRGFVLLDCIQQERRIRQEQWRAMGNVEIETGPTAGTGIPWADNFEVFLVTELAKDSYDKAIDYARSFEDSHIRLQFMIGIARSLGEASY